ncbi:MAG: DUF2284 domain-containing protein [Firmicutes bacterium]|nr:DUF2284 domain-containing protein [Bacillota bacterium]
MKTDDNLKETIRQAALEQGFFQAEYVERDNIVFYPELRAICEGNQCGCYGANWVCPPAFGDFEEGKAKILSYENMLLITKKYDLEDSFDFEGMQEGMRDFRRSLPAIEGFAWDLLGPENVFVLSVGSCRLCSECTYPDAPCRFPKLLHHPIEGYGLNVNELAESCGITYNNGKNTVTYFGALLF